jgi:hypothetical protein
MADETPKKSIRQQRTSTNISSTRTQEQIENPPKNQNLGLTDPSIVKKVPFEPSSLETIDGAVMDYVENRLEIAITSNEGFKKVPVLWVSAERAYQIKHNKDLHDAEETLILPLITINRASIQKNPASEYAIPAANVPEVRDAMGGSITVGRRINQQKTAEFQNAYAKKKFGRETWPAVRNNKTVYQTISMPFPTWIGVNYEISIRTEYQQQMNEIIRKFIREGGLNRMPFRLENEGHKYEAFFEGEMANNSNVAAMGMSQRNYESIINMKVLGYLIGDGDNQNKPNLVYRENAVDIQIPREKVIVGEIQDFLDNSGFYKE